MFSKHGPAPLLDPVANAVFVSREQQRGDVGTGVNRRLVSTHGRQIMGAIAEHPSADPQDKDAKCGRNWVKNSLKRARELMPELDPTYVKA